MSLEESLPYRPHYCVWELTLACNLRCGHCGSRAGLRRDNELGTGECVDLVHQLADLECRLITLSGGEPTLRPDWPVIARAAIGRSMVVNMVTNGTTMSKPLAARMAEVGLSNVGISLDGTPEVHDAMRGEGTFAKLARGLTLLHDAGVPYSLLTHLNRDTLGELEDIHHLAVNLGAFAWRVQLGKPMGNLGDNRGLCIEPQDLLSVLPRLARLKKTSSIRVDVGDSLGYYGPHERVLRQSGWGNMRPLWSGCQAGRRAIGIESDGTIKGCLSLQGGRDEQTGEDFFAEDNIRRRTLREIWFDPHAFAFNRQQTVDDLTGYCARCRHASQCRGGAKCVASAFTGAVSEDPYCYWRMSQLTSRRGRALAAVRQRAAVAAAAVTLGLGAAGAVCLGGCLDRAVGDPDPNRQQDAAPLVLSDAGVDADFEPPVHMDYGVFPEPELSDAGVDAAPPFEGDYGMMPPSEDAAVDSDAEPPTEMDYGNLPPQD